MGTAYPIYVGSGNGASAAITNQYDIYAYQNNFGTITNRYGFAYLPSNSGTITNAYGLYVSGLGTGGTYSNPPYDLYMADSTSLNYFAGNVGIGTTSPGQKLSVVGTIESTSGGFKFPDGTTQTTAVSSASPPFAISCTSNSANMSLCVRLNTLTGASSCMDTTNPGAQAWSACFANPFAAGANANYSISCSSPSSSIFYCVLLNNNTGTSSCVSSTNPTNQVWTACVANPF